MDKLIRNFKENWQKLDVNQKITATILVFLVISLPIGIFLSLNPTKYFSRAQIPATPPQQNNSPVITTTSLKDGFMLKNYKANIEGIDSNIGDSLSFKLFGLPNGLDLKNCIQSQRRIKSILNEVLNCKINGIATQKGQFNIEVVLYDDKGGSDIKMLQLNLY